MKRKWTNPSLYYKLIMLFVATLVPLYLLSFALNELSMNGINDQKAKALSNQAHDFMLQLEREIERISNIQQLNFHNDESLMEFSTRASAMSSYTLGQTVNMLHDNLITMKYSSDYIQDIYVFTPSQHKLVSTADYYKSEFTADELRFYRSTPGSQIMTYENGRLYISFHYPTIGKREPLNYVQVELSIPTLARMLSQFDPEGGAELIASDWAISSEAGNRPAELLSERVGERPAEGTYIRKVDKVNYVFSVETSSLLDLSLLVYVPEHKVLGNLEKYRNFFWALLAASVVITIIISLSLHRMIKTPLRRMVALFTEVERGNFNLVVEGERDDEFGYLFRGFRKMLGELKRLIEETFVQKMGLHQAEIKQLQTQINPHFLYNSFNILRHTIKYQDYETAEAMSKHLGDYFQFITRNDNDNVSLAFEYQHAETYLEIQKIRFQDRIKIEIAPLPVEYSGLIVPRLIMQPLIENAYEHGVSKMYSGGIIRMFVTGESKAVIITVENNGPGMEEAELQSLKEKLISIGQEEDHTGLLNIHWRLRLKYGDAGGLDVANTPFGFRVQLFIPLTAGGEADVPINDRR